jgi:hypothetical protein
MEIGVESHNYLGIYLRQDRATVVCVASQGRDHKLLDCFSVSVEAREEQEDGRQQALADRIAKACSERGLKFGQAAVALDCGMFMQHAVHSEFGEYKKIVATVRFDTEEALATDVADVAVAFRVLSSDENGSNLDVYTVPRDVLSGILISLQSVGIDPVCVNPDTWCLSCYLSTYGVSAEGSGQKPLYALLSDSRGYLVTAPQPPQSPTTRAFPIAPVQNREQLLAREVLLTAALAEADGPVDQVRLFDVNDEVAAQPLGKRVGRPVEMCDLVRMAAIEPHDIADCTSAMDFALAYGAALTLPEKDKGVNFRNDHMPYQGEKIRTNRALKLLSIAAAILLLSIGVHFQTRLMKVNQARAAIRAKFEPDYLAVMLGKSKMPDTIKTATDELGRARHQIMIEKGIGGVPQESISAKLALVLQAINSCTAQTGLVIDTITIGDKNIHINGSTSGRPKTTLVFEALQAAGLESQGGLRVTQDGDRDKFDVVVQLAQSPDRS